MINAVGTRTVRRVFSQVFNSVSRAGEKSICDGDICSVVI